MIDITGTPGSTGRNTASATWQRRHYTASRTTTASRLMRCSAGPRLSRRSWTKFFSVGVAPLCDTEIADLGWAEDTIWTRPGNA